MNDNKTTQPDYYIYFHNAHGVRFRAKLRSDGSYIAQKKFMFWWITPTKKVAHSRYIGGGMNEVSIGYEPTTWEDADEVRFDIETIDGLIEEEPNEKPS